MNTFKMLVLSAAILSALALTGCSETTTQITDSDGSVPGKNVTRILTTWANDYHYSFLACQSTGETWNSDGTDTVSHTFATDQAIHCYVWRKGGLTFAGNGVSNVDTSTYSYHGTITSMLVNGTTQYFAVSGNPSSGSWSVGVASPLNQIALVSLGNRDKITKSSGMTVTWAQAGSGTQLIGIHVIPRYGTVDPVFVETNDDGSYTFTGSDLSSLPTGQFYIVIQRGNLVTGTAPDGKDYLAALYTQDQHTGIFQ